MTLPAKKHLINLERIKNPAETRLGYLRLDKNENTAGFPQEFVDMLRKEVNSDFLTTYPEIDPLYGKIAKWIGCSKENIYISAGSDGAIKSVFEIFVEPGDKVVMLSPTYAMFYVYAKMFQANLIKIHYGKDLSLSVEDIIKAIRDLKPKLVCIANPNSPTGTVISQKDIHDIVEAATRENAILLLDEAYCLFYPVSSIELIESYPQLIITRTFSKAFGLASGRLGFAAGHSDIINCLHKVRPLYETNAFVVRFAELVLDNYSLVEKNIAKINKGKEFLQKQLDKSGISYFKSYANFVLIDVGSYERSIEIGKALRKKMILIKSGFKEDILRNCIRVSTGNVEQMKLFLEAFKEVISSLEGRGVR